MGFAELLRFHFLTLPHETFLATSFFFELISFFPINRTSWINKVSLFLPRYACFVFVLFLTRLSLKVAFERSSAVPARVSIIISLATRHIDLSISGTRYSVSRGIILVSRSGHISTALTSKTSLFSKKVFFPWKPGDVFRVIKLREVDHQRVVNNFGVPLDLETWDRARRNGVSL